jgi:hypothetical protein
MLGFKQLVTITMHLDACTGPHRLKLPVLNSTPPIDHALFSTLRADFLVSALQQLQCCPEDGFDTLEASICVNRRDSDDDYDFDEDDYESDGEPDPNAWTDKPRMGIARAVAKSKAQAAQKLYSGGGDNEEEPVDASFHQTMSFTIPRASLDASLTGSEASDDVSFTLDANALAGLWVPITPLAPSSHLRSCVFLHILSSRTMHCPMPSPI